jgi:site-specific DNA-methyltransferase (adenine-specific)
MFLKHGAEFKDWRFAQDVVWQKQNGTGFADDRFRRVHESVTHWYRGEWAEQGQSVPRLRRIGPAKAITTRGQTPHTGAIGNVGYVDDGTRLMLSVIPAANMQGRALHPTEKPAGIVRPLLEYSWHTGTVLDPFSGSGVVLAEAKALGIPATGVEVNEAYCEIAAQRLSQNVLNLGGDYPLTASKS